MDRKHWPFKLANKGGKPMIQVDHRGDTKDFVSLRTPVIWDRADVQTPEEISAMVLTKMKETAEAYLGHKVTHAVVTVPACQLS